MVLDPDSKTWSYPPWIGKPYRAPLCGRLTSRPHESQADGICRPRIGSILAGHVQGGPIRAIYIVGGDRRIRQRTGLCSRQPGSPLYGAAGWTERQSYSNNDAMRAVSLLFNLFLFSLVCFAGKGAAQEAGGDLVLKKANAFRCSFPVGASANMVGDVPKPETGPEDPGELIFDQIDVQKGSGRFIGNIGTSNLIVIDGVNRISLLEITETGNLQVTVIYGAQDSSGRFKAVHSRHTAFEGLILLPSQSYGSCLALFP